MGGKSKSASSSRNETNTYTQNLNLQDVQAPVVAGEGNEQNLYLSDHGAIEGSFEVVTDALALVDATAEQTQETLRHSNELVLDTAGEIFTEALDTAGGVFTEALGFADKANARATDAVTGNSEKFLEHATRVQTAAYDWADDVTRSEISQGFDTLIKYGAGAAVLSTLAVSIAAVVRSKK